MLVVIPATSKHKLVVEISIARLKCRYPEANFLIVCPSPEVFANLIGSDVRIEADDVYACINRTDIAATLSPAKRHLAGWYYQQLLKYAVVSKEREARVLVLDADTVLIGDIQCELNNFFTSKERHEEYFEHFRYLFFAEAPFKASAIANFMWFDVVSLRTMLDEIERHHNNEWWKVIIEIANEISAEGVFSEYETYANWFSIYHGCHVEVPINIFRRGDLLIRTELDYKRVIAEVEAKGYFAVSFELNHRSGFIRRLGAWIVLKLAIKWW